MKAAPKALDVSSYPTFIMFRGAEKAREAGPSRERMPRRPPRLPSARTRNRRRCDAMRKRLHDSSPNPPAVVPFCAQIGETSGAVADRIEALLKLKGAQEVRFANQRSLAGALVAEAGRRGERGSVL